MELASKVGDAVSKALNSNKVLNVVLLSAFGLLCMRSVQQQKNMEVLEAEKDSLLNSNKAMKKAMWDWKQQLFAEADLPNSLIPLSKLKTIYGEVQTTPSSSGMNFPFFFLYLRECFCLNYSIWALWELHKLAGLKMILWVWLVWIWVSMILLYFALWKMVTY